MSNSFKISESKANGKSFQEQLSDTNDEKVYYKY